MPRKTRSKAQSRLLESVNELLAQERKTAKRKAHLTGGDFKSRDSSPLRP